LIHTFTDSVYRYGSGQPGHMIEFFTLAEGRVLHIDMELVGIDSTRLRFTGYRYVGPWDRPGVIVNGPDAWTAIAKGDSAEALILAAPTRVVEALRTQRAEVVPAGRHVVTLLGPPGALPTPDSLLRDLPDGLKAFCRANYIRKDALMIIDVVTMKDWCTLSAHGAERLAGNTYLLRDPDKVAIGDTVDICTISGMPRGFQVIESYTDSKHCPFDHNWKWKREPNRVKVRRVE